MYFIQSVYFLLLIKKQKHFLNKLLFFFFARCGRRSCLWPWRTETRLKSSAVRTWRFCTTLCSWRINASWIPSTVTSWGKGASRFLHFKPARRHVSRRSYPLLSHVNKSCVLYRLQSEMVFHGNGRHRVSHRSQHYHAGQRADRTDRVSFSSSRLKLSRKSVRSLNLHVY